MSKVKLGKLERKEKYESDKQQLRDERDTKLKKLDQKKDSLNKYQKNVYDDSDERKAIRAEKRAYMQELRDKERGQRKADRKNQRIDRIMNRNNMTREEASQEYDRRRETLDSYSKGPRENLNVEQLRNAYNPPEKNSTDSPNPDDKTNKEKVGDDISNKANQQLVTTALNPTQPGWTKRDFLEDY